MPNVLRSREGTITAVSTKTQLSTLGSESAPGPFLVPKGAKRIKRLIVAVGCDLTVAADGAYMIRLEGSGLPEGPEVFAIGATGVPVATGGVYVRAADVLDVDIKVTESNEILLFAENLGEDTGSTTVGVTCEFEM